MKVAMAISRDAHHSAIRVALPYLVISGLYIVASDRMLEWVTSDTAILTRLQTYKGIAFILATAGLVYGLVYWQVRRLIVSELGEQQQREQFRRAFEDAVTGMALLSPDGCFQRVNPVLCGMLGRSQDDLIGTNVMDITHPDDRSLRAQVLRRLRDEAARIEPYEIRCLTGDGRTIWVLASSTLCRDIEGQPLYFLSQIVDVTQRREAEHRIRQQEAQLMHASRLITLGEMASGLAHDLSQPISTILQYTETSLDMLQRGRTDQIESIIGALHDVVGQAEHTRQIVTRLRSLARKHTPEHRPMQINDLIRETLRLMSYEAERRNVCVTLDLQPDLPMVSVDPVQFQQLIINLFNNAIEALVDTPVPQRRVLARTVMCEDSEKVRVMICDSGPGPDQGVAGRLFDAFVTTKSNGMGLGLSICKTIVESHGGRLWHERNDELTVFTFELPPVEVPACLTNPR
jgi:two-component system sensor histidine kinase DctS